MRLSNLFRTIAAGSVFALVAGFGSANAASILYFVDDTVGTDWMASALAEASSSHTVTTAASNAQFSTLLADGGFDVAILFQQNSTGLEYDQAWDAVAAHLAGGGVAIGADWSLGDDHALAFGTTFTGNTNNQQVTITDASLATGIDHSVLLSNPGWGRFSTGLVPTSGICAGTFSNGECAIVSDHEGRSLFFGFLSDTFTDGAEGVQFYRNVLNDVIDPAAGSNVPMPAPVTISLFGLGLAGFWAMRRRRIRI